MPAVTSANDLRWRLAIQVQKTLPVNEYGEQAPPIWETKATVWGAVDPLSGAEIFQAAQVQARLTLRVRIRWYPKLTTAHRFLWLNPEWPALPDSVGEGAAGLNAKILNVDAIVPDPKRFWTLCNVVMGDEGTR